jgi:hypothetical protein
MASIDTVSMVGSSVLSLLGEANIQVPHLAFTDTHLRVIIVTSGWEGLMIICVIATNIAGGRQGSLLPAGILVPLWKRYLHDMVSFGIAC